MSKNNKYIKGKVVGKFRCKRSKKGDTYLSGTLSKEHGGIKVTLIKQFNKEGQEDADCLLLTYDPVKDFDDKKIVFKEASVSEPSQLFGDDDSPDFSDEDLDRWLAENRKSK